MKIGILGTGNVGRNMGSKLMQLGHEVKLGSRSADNQKAMEWVSVSGNGASCGTFGDAASFGEIVFNCTSGMHSLEALKLAGDDNLQGKILIDVANPLDFSKGMPPTLSVCNDDSLGEQIQKAFPKTDVVKAFNTMSATVMTNPSLVPGEHDAFVCGNSDKAKAKVIAIMKDELKWNSIIDLGDITASRGTEMILPLWVRLMGKFQRPQFNFKIVR